MTDLIWMDGYGPFVWSAWIIAGAGLKGLLAWTILASRRVPTGGRRTSKKTSQGAGGES